MNAGRELDALVAEKVMGFRLVKAETVEALGFGKGGTYPPPKHVLLGITRDEIVIEGTGMRVPAYSTDIAAAWEVAKKMDRITIRMCDGTACITAPKVSWEWGGPLERMPEMICLAALKAFGAIA